MRNKTIFYTNLILLTILVSLSGLLVYVVLNFSPKQLGPAMVTFWFVGVLLLVAAVVILLDYNWKLRKEAVRMQPNKALVASIRTGVLFGFTAAILLALSSLRSLSLRDVILFVLTIVIIELFFRTRKIQ